MLRWVAAFVMAGFVKPPIFMNFTMSSDRAFLAVHPGTAKGLNAYLDFLPESVPVEWGATLAGDDIAGLAEMIIDRGGHISVGLGDYAYGDSRTGRSPTESFGLRRSSGARSRRPPM